MAQLDSMPLASTSRRCASLWRAASAVRRWPSVPCVDQARKPAGPPQALAPTGTVRHCSLVLQAAGPISARSSRDSRADSGSGADAWGLAGVAAPGVVWAQLVSAAQASRGASRCCGFMAVMVGRPRRLGNHYDVPMRVLLLLPSLVCAGLAVAHGEPCRPEAETARAALNALRAQARSCGGRVLPAAPPLRWLPLLDDSAQRQARDLATRDRLDHVGAAGASLRSRLREAGYPMRVAGENLAGGPETLDEVLAQWLASPAHCENLMAADVQEFGLACANGSGALQHYWVLHLAAPLPGDRPRSSPGRSP